MPFVACIIIVCLSFGGCATDNLDALTMRNDSTVVGDTVNGEIYGLNILKNGGLEEWYGVMTYPYDVPVDWGPHNNNNVKCEYDIVFEGDCSARLSSVKSGSTARIDQKIPVTPGGKIRIRFCYYVEQWKTNGARTYCYFRTKLAESSTISISDLRELYSDDEYFIIRGGGYGLKFLPHTTNVWQVFDETIKVPPTATYFEFGVNSYYGTTIYVDDCYVGELVE